MNIIKLDAIDSTNNYLKKMILHGGINDYTVVTAKFQTEGKGQLGTKWESEHSKNLICSVYKKNINIKVQDQFVISALVSLALVKTLRKINLSNLHIKWPNDIMSDNKKICGILIENIVMENYIKDIVIGIGLNVNQTIFNNLPNATSIKNLIGATCSIDEILEDLLPKNISTQVFKALLENAASEQGSRMTAMDNATRNAGDLVDKLTINYNRSRQASITKELIEIISGAESL